MRFYKKISLFMSLAIIFVCIPNYIYAKSSINTDDSFKINFLETLNILSVSDMNTDFSEESKITRGQLAVYTARLMNISADNDYGEEFFKDLPKNHYAFGAVKSLVEKGIIHGSGDYFYPDSNITSEQAIKIMVSALGYSVAAEAKNGYPYGYISVARDIDLLDGVNIIEGQELTKIEAVRLLFNSLSIGQMSISVYGINPSFAPDEDTTFLSMRNIKKYKGQVIANEASAITGTIVAPDDSVKIGEYNFKCGDTNISEYLGQVVSIYYSFDDNDIYTVLFVEESSSNVIEIFAKDIEKFENGYYYYNDSERNRRIKISGTCNIIYNGKVPTAFKATYMTPNSGKVKIIDNSNNISEDLVIITDVTDYRVLGIDEKNNRLYCEDDVIKSFGNAEIDVYNTNGNVVPFEAITEGSIVSVAESDDGKYAAIYISDKTVIGTVAAVENESEYSNIVIGNDGYRLLTGIGTIPDVGKKIIAHINAFGDIGYIENEENDGLLYGYMSKAKLIRKEDAVTLEILTEKGELEKFYISDKVWINDVRYKNRPDDVFNELNGHITATAADEKVIKFELDSDNRIKKMYVYDSTNKNYIHEMKFVNTTTIRKKYNSKQQTFAGEVTLSDNVIVFTISSDIYKSEVATKSRFGNENTYPVYCYSFGDTPFADVAVMDGKTASTYKYMAVVQKISRVFDEETEEVKTELTVLMEGKEQFFSLEEGAEVYTLDASKNEVIEGGADKIKKGDVIRLALTTKNEVRRVMHIYDKGGSTYLLGISPYEKSNGYFSEQRIMYADVVSTKKGLLRIKDALNTSSTQEENCLMSKYFIYKYDDTEGKWKIGKESEITSSSKLLVGTNYGDPMEIIILN